MMQLSELYRLSGGDGQSMYDYAKKNKSNNSINEAIKEYIPTLHDVANKGKRPDKIVYVPILDDDGRDTGQMTTDLSKVSRVPLPIQKYIISQKASFIKGNGLILKPTNEDSEVYERVKENWKKLKADFDLKEIARTMMAETKVAVIFYGEKKESVEDFNFRYKIVSPLRGDNIEAYFDEDSGDLIAFSREFKVKKDTFCDLYIINEKTKLCEIWKYKNGKPLMINVVDELEQLESTQHEVIKTTYTKLPIVYWEQEQGECIDTKELISEFENEFSDFLTQMAYTADPILFAKGETMSLPAKGVRGKLVESNSPEAELKYVTPENATESRDLQFKLMSKFIFSLNRSVLLDLETLKGLGQGITGAGLERLLIDVYMDASDKQEGEFGKGVQRMVNWLVSQWEVFLNKKEKGFRIDVEFTKYSMQDDLERVELAVKANGNKPVVDMRGGIELAGISNDIDDTINNIKAEQSVNAQPNNIVTTS